MDYDDIASALLAQVNLSWNDVYYMQDRGKGLLRYRGHCCMEAGFPRIGLSVRKMDVVNLYVLAHECGHIRQEWWNTSVKEYIQEYDAEIYALAAMDRFGLKHDFMVDHAKKYVRQHCFQRELILWPWLDGPFAWNWEILEWCGYRPVMGLPEDDWCGFHFGAYEKAKKIMGTWDESAPAAEKTRSKAAFFRSVGESRGRYMSA